MAAILIDQTNVHNLNFASSSKSFDFTAVIYIFFLIIKEAHRNYLFFISIIHKSIFKMSQNLNFSSDLRLTDLRADSRNK